MSKCLKIVLAIFLSLIIIAGGTVGIITQGFRKWDKLKDNKITNFYHNGKTGIASEDYMQLQEDYNNLENLIYNHFGKENSFDYKIFRNSGYSSFWVEIEKDRFMLYSFDGKSVNKFVSNLPKTSARIKDLKNLFSNSSVYYEYKKFDVFAVYQKNTSGLYQSPLTEFKVENINANITNDYISKTGAKFSIVYSDNITEEQKSLIEIGTDENIRFNVNYEFDLKLDDYTDLYNVDVCMIVESVVA